MLEAILFSLSGFLLLAAAAHRFRREIGPIGPHAQVALRLLGAALIVCGLPWCSSPLPGEWAVRFLTASSVAATLVALALSAVPAFILAPLRVMLAVTRR